MGERRARLSPVEKAEIVRLRVEDRLSSVEIAARMNSNATTVCDLVKPFPLTAKEMKARKAKTAKIMRQALPKIGPYVGGADWSDEQNKLLKRLWPTHSRQRVEAAFPDRTWAAISKQANLLSIRRPRSANGTRKKKSQVDPFIRSLREIREARGITREELADKAGFHRIHFARIELGEARPSWFLLRAWLQALGYEIQAIPKTTPESALSETRYQQDLGRSRRPWLPDEESILKELLAQGSTILEASVSLKRPASEVEKRALTLGLLESEATRNVSGMMRRRLGMMVMRATSFAESTLRIPTAEASSIAADAVTYVWEECKFGRVTAEDGPSFWALVSERLYKTRNNWRTREISLDAPIPNTEGDADGHDAGWNGYQPPDQIDVTYLNEVKAGIQLLPRKHRSVMTLIAEGHNALDVSAELRIPIHTVFRLIAEGRQFLFAREMIGLAKDKRRAQRVTAE